MDLPPQMIQVDVDPAAIGRNYPVRLPVVADAKVALGSIADALGSGAGPNSPNRTDDVARLRKAAFERARRDGPLEMDLLDAIGSALPPEAVTVHDMTAASAWAAPFLSVEVPGTFHTPYGFGSAGFALPAAVGISCALPGRPVVVFAGQRSLAYHARELGILAQHRSPVTVLVFEDGDDGEGSQAPAGAVPDGEPTAGQWVETIVSSQWVEAVVPGRLGPDLPALAATYGVLAEQAPAPEALERILRAAVQGDEPRLVEVPGPWGPPAPSSSRT
jgi:thiamine pyrophosphate-dependent acetolactate synthase large subunit-like protein